MQPKIVQMCRCSGTRTRFTILTSDSDSAFRKTIISILEFEEREILRKKTILQRIPEIRKNSKFQNFLEISEFIGKSIKIRVCDSGEYYFKVLE